MKRVEDILFKLVAAGLGDGNDALSLPNDVDWGSVFNMAKRQGVAAICLDGVQRLKWGTAIPSIMKIQWIGAATKQELIYNAQWRAAETLTNVWHEAGLETYVIKGFALAEMYPRPAARYSCNMDCFLIEQHECCGEKGNVIVESKGVDVDRSYYKNSKFNFNGLTVENHRYLLPVKGSRKTKHFERWLRTQMETAEPKYIGDTYL